MSNIEKKYVDYAGLQGYDSLIKGAISTVFVGASSSEDGEAGRVPAPNAGDENNFLRGDGSWGAIVFKGTFAAWNALSASEKAKYANGLVVLEDD